jgi:hypothetical protein
MAAVVGSSGGSPFREDVESGDRFYVGAPRRNLALFVVKVFPYLIYFLKKCYKCTFSAICKDSDLVNCINFQSDKVHYPQILQVILCYYTK